MNTDSLTSRSVREYCWFGHYPIEIFAVRIQHTRRQSTQTGPMVQGQYEVWTTRNLVCQELSAPGDPGRDICQVTLVNCLQMKIGLSASRVPSIYSVATEYKVSQAIHNIVSETLETRVTGQLNMHTSILYHRAAQQSRFMDGRQYKQLLPSVIRTRDSYCSLGKLPIYLVFS
ncbi:hypothetical protein F5141DRAFT_1122274 [Pisolithus sp. B1]|nr:hypothetical protein F5141DRAFT_1122274 [Pisolithus sp. B1]